MEIKPAIAAVLLLSLLLTKPHISKGGSGESDPNVYDIDYRGPETHSPVPPPDHFRARPYLHQESKAPRDDNNGIHGKKNRG